MSCDAENMNLARGEVDKAMAAAARVAEALEGGGGLDAPYTLMQVFACLSRARLFLERDAALDASVGG